MSMLLSFLALAAAPAADPVAGTWRNAADTVRIRIERCRGEPGMCGTVVAADAKAREDAARGGTERLVGTQLLHVDAQGDGTWAGRVFVPDVGTEVDGTLRLDGRNTLAVEGCLFAGFGCREQRWTRVAAAPPRR